MFKLLIGTLAMALPLLAHEGAPDEFRYNGAAEPEPPFPMTLPTAPRFPARDFDIRQYGAVADGCTLSTSAFARAIAACSQAGGGRVVVPAGEWLTGAIQLRSNINLYLAEGATVRFSTDPKDYLPAVWVRWAGFECMNYSPLIYARGCTNIAITGRGTVDGQGERWWYWGKYQTAQAQPLYQMTIDNVPVEKRVFARPENFMRPQFIQPIDCHGVLVEGIKIVSGPFWTLQFAYCDQVIARNLTIRTSGSNNDGIDLDSCHDALIENCDVSAGDDCICMKSGINEEGRRIGRPTERVVIRHCLTRSGHGGFVIGSDTSGGIRNIFVYDCDFEGTDVGLRIKSARGRGGVVENIWCRDLRMRNINAQAIQITSFYRAWFGADHGPAPLFRNLHFDNIAVNVALTGIEIAGLPEQAIEGLTFRHLHISSHRGLTCTDAQGITLDDVFLNPYSADETLSLKNTRDVTVEHCRDAEGCGTYLVASGRISGIKLIGDDFSQAKTVSRLGPGISDSAVQRIDSARE